MAKRVAGTLKQEDWISAALSLLNDNGSAGVSVVKLAKHLGVTRGSFYHHFASLNDLIDAMVARWEKNIIDRGFQEAFEQASSAPEEIRLVIEFVSRLTDRQDLVFRQWAVHNTHVRAHMERLDQKRLETMMAMFERLAGDRQRGEAYAKIAFYGYIGCLNSYPRPSAQKQKALALEILQLFQADLQHHEGA